MGCEAPEPFLRRFSGVFTGCFDSDLPATTEVVLALRDVVLALAMAAAPSLN